MNRIFITLIPKLDNSKASILASSIKPLLNKKVYPLRGVFMSCRLINDNILLTHEIMYFFKKTKSKFGYMPFKLDMEKAFDGLE